MKQSLRGFLTMAAAAGVLAVWTVLTACSGSGGMVEPLSAAEVGDRVVQAVSVPDMKPGDAEKLEKLYRIEAAEIEDFILYVASSNVQADELAVIRFKDEKLAERSREKFAQRIETQAAKFKDYRPELFFLIEKHVWKAKGRYVLFAVSKEAEPIERAFDDALK